MLKFGAIAGLFAGVPYGVTLAKGFFVQRSGAEISLSMAPKSRIFPLQRFSLFPRTYGMPPEPRRLVTRFAGATEQKWKTGGLLPILPCSGLTGSLRLFQDD